MPKCVMQVIGFPNGAPCSIRGQFLESFDFEAYNGIGFGTFTLKPGKAMVFEDAGKAMEYWKTQSKTVPHRPDGKPNRPLTCTTFAITPLEDVV